MTGRVVELFSFLLAKFKLGEWMSSLDVLEWLFLTMSPIEWYCPSVLFFNTSLRSASFVPWELDISFLIDLPHDLRCILLSLLISFSLYLLRCRSYWYCYSPFYFYSLFFFCAVACVALHPITLITMAYCDQGFSKTPSPPTPIQLPEEPLTPPEAPPVAPPIIIPQFDQPLLSDAHRRNVLYQRYSVLNFGGNDSLACMVSIIDSQFIIERNMEAAVVDDGFRPQSILYRMTEIRGFIHSPAGDLLSSRTYQSYITSCVGLRGRSSEREGLISDLIRIAIVKYRFMEAVVEKQGEGFRPRERGKALQDLTANRSITQSQAIPSLSDFLLSDHTRNYVSTYRSEGTAIITTTHRMNCRVNRSDPDAAVAPRRYGLDPILSTLGHHSMSGIRGDILDVSTPLVGGCAALPFDRYTVEEADHECYR
ncbi:hypothetical protein OROMI_004722 [Orobanche minor]